MAKIRSTATPNELRDSARDSLKESVAETAVARTRDFSFQDRATADVESGGVGRVLDHLIRINELIAPWWCVQRDLDLRKFWKQSDHLSGAMRAITNKITTIDFKVRPRDRSVTSQVKMAAEAEATLRTTPEYGKGWTTWLGKFLEDLLGVDNGGFAEIIGGGRPDGPIVGKALSIAHLDSTRAMRTSNPEFPVIYQDTDGRRYKIHYTRLLSASLLPSADVEMHDVGFSCVSGAVNNAQCLIDISRYKQEKLGSRPARGIIVGKKGISPEEILYAFWVANEQMDSEGLSRYAKLVVIAPDRGRGEIDLDFLPLSELPDGFDEKDSTTLGMFAIALAFGVDARELWPSSTTGASKADAMIQHLKARGKGPGHIMSIVEHQINQKFLPPSLIFKFDWQDDEQDMLRAEVRDKRSQRHERDVLYGGIDLRTVREEMLEDQDITRAQFAAMELEDGRLEDGASVLTLFFSTDPLIKELLDVGDVGKLMAFTDGVEEGGELREVGERARMRGVLDKALMKAYKALADAGWSTQKAKVRQCVAALEFLKKKWEPQQPQDSPPRGVPGPVPQRTASDRERIRNEDDYRGDGEAQIVEDM